MAHGNGIFASLCLHSVRRNRGVEVRRTSTSKVTTNAKEVGAAWTRFVKSGSTPKLVENRLSGRVELMSAA